MNPVLKGYSSLENGTEALSEAIVSWDREARMAINFLLVYHSSRQSAEEVAAALGIYFPDIPSAGCSTAGEFLDGERHEGSLVIFGFVTPEVAWQVVAVPKVEQFVPTDAQLVVEQLLKQMGDRRQDLNAEQHFCMVLQDGLGKREELLTASLAMELGSERGGVPLIGGSAGDDLKFEHTWQIVNGKAYQGGAAVILGKSRVPYHLIKHQHYVPAGDHDFVVTYADVDQRRVYTLNGMPAADEFARAIGETPESLSNRSYGKYPLIYQERGEYYVRSIQKVEEDRSLTFYCAIEEGALLDLGRHQSPKQVLKEDLARLREKAGELSLMLVFSCILCKLELQGDDHWGALLHEASPNVIGFDTYGEQLNGLHINQTLVAIAFGAME